MARHNRRGRGEDQRGHEYVVAYQPDWLYEVKVTRRLESGRQSTKTLFRNPEAPRADPGARVSTRISAPALGLDLGIDLDDPRGTIRKIRIDTVTQERGDPEPLSFSISRRRVRPSV